MHGEAMSPEETRNWVEGENAARLNREQARFTRECGAQLAENCAYLTVETAKRYLQIKGGKPPSAFGDFDRDEIARTLAVDTTISYDGYVCDNGGFCETTWQTEAIEMWDRSKFVEAYGKYLGTAANFAEARGCADAAQGYRKAEQIVCTKTNPLYQRPLSPNDALEVVALEKAATESLSKRKKGAAK